MATCVVLQHAETEAAFAVGDALAAAGVTLDVRRPYQGDTIPTSAAGLQGLVAMGGVMSAASDEGFPSRGAELALLRDAVDLGVPVLGVCLGAQLLARAGGAPVYAGAVGLEVGWGPVHLEDAAAGDRLFGGLPSPLWVLNWHGDTFDLPTGAVRLASGDVYQNQVFRFGDRAWGVQFHLEVDAAVVDSWIEAFPDEEAQAAGGTAGLRAATVAGMDELRAAREVILGRFAALVATPPVPG
jgi:GMP synthase-like glutamine amidotransferase